LADPGSSNSNIGDVQDALQEEGRTKINLGPRTRSFLLGRSRYTGVEIALLSGETGKQPIIPGSAVEE
jgi:hypothetical protein